jgi:hypothetical protein
VAIDFDAFRLFNRHSFGLMRSAVEHGCKSEEFSGGRLVYHDFLLIFVGGSNANCSRDHHVGSSARVAGLINALPRGELLGLYLTDQYREFVFIQQSEQWNISQYVYFTGHASPQVAEGGFYNGEV